LFFAFEAETFFGADLFKWLAAFEEMAEAQR
jgi:hypothetical protein